MCLVHFFLLFWIGEDWISCYKINESENDFMKKNKKLYDYEFLFWYCKTQRTNENILIFQPYVGLTSSSSTTMWSPWRI